MLVAFICISVTTIARNSTIYVFTYSHQRRTQCWKMEKNFSFYPIIAISNFIRNTRRAHINVDRIILSDL